MLSSANRSIGSWSIRINSSSRGGQMPSLDWNSIRIFVFGALTAIVFAIIANLLTPDLKSLINWLRFWRANSSISSASNEIARYKQLQYEYGEIRDNPTALLCFIARDLFSILLFLCLAILSFSMMMLYGESRLLLIPFLFGILYTGLT